MKKILFLAVIALIAAPVFAAGTLANVQIPVMMVIDKTVTLTVSPAQITLAILDPTIAPGDSIYRGYTGVTITHNFPVIVTATIVPFGPSLGAGAQYRTILALSPTALPQTAAQWTGVPSPATPLMLNTPAPAPTGEIFYVGAAVLDVDFTFAPSSVTAVQVATVGITVSDNL